MTKTLPFPSTVDLAHTRRSSPRRIILWFAGLLLAAYCITQFTSTPPSRIDVEHLDWIIEQGTPQTKVGAPPPEGLTPLGIEADESYHLGATDISEYRSELRNFVKDTFPYKLQKPAIDSIDSFLLEVVDNALTKFAPIPSKIWQTARNHDPDAYHEWKEQPGYDYTFFNDAAADKWVQDHFGGSRIRWAWDVMGPGILVRIFSEGS